MDPTTIPCKMEMVYQGLSPRRTGGHELAACKGSPDFHITHMMAAGSPLPQRSLRPYSRVPETAGGGSKAQAEFTDELAQYVVVN